MAIPDLNDRSLFPPFAELPADHGEDGRWLLAQIKDNMTITKPTLVLTDRDGHPFALVFDGLDRDGLDLGKLGLKKGATAVVRDAHQSVPAGGGGGDGDNGNGIGSGHDSASMASSAAKRPFVRIAAGQAHTVHAVPGGLPQTLAAAGKLRTKLAAATERCDACGSTGDGSRLLGCTGCSQAQYCNRTKGWSDGHKGECKAWRALTTIWA